MPGLCWGLRVPRSIGLSRWLVGMVLIRRWWLISFLNPLGHSSQWSGPLWIKPLPLLTISTVSMTTIYFILDWVQWQNSFYCCSAALPLWPKARRSFECTFTPGMRFRSIVTLSDLKLTMQSIKEIYFNTGYVLMAWTPPELRFFLWGGGRQCFTSEKHRGQVTHPQAWW